jgi:hypothetical protein
VEPRGARKSQEKPQPWLKGRSIIRVPMFSLESVAVYKGFGAGSGPATAPKDLRASIRMVFVATHFAMVACQRWVVQWMAVGTLRNGNLMARGEPGETRRS